jgi:hypothetical protein
MKYDIDDIDDIDIVAYRATRGSTDAEDRERRAVENRSLIPPGSEPKRHTPLSMCSM